MEDSSFRYLLVSYLGLIESIITIDGVRDLSLITGKGGGVKNREGGGSSSTLTKKRDINSVSHAGGEGGSTL